MDTKMWGKALTAIPRLDKKAWTKLDVISKWLISTRAAVLIMTFLSAAIGGILAYRNGKFNLYLWLICALGLVMAHATNNLLNDLVDHFKGTDKGNYYRAKYGPQPLEHKLMTRFEVLLYIFFTGSIAFLAGAYLVYARGIIAFYLMLAGSFFLLFYTWPLKYFGLGELAVVLVWGPLMIGGSYFISSGVWSSSACLVSLPYALGVTTVIFGKHIDKLAEDRKKKIYTLPVLLGEKLSRITVIALMLGMYFLAAYFALVRGFYPLLLVFLSLNVFRGVLQVFGKPRPKSEPKNYPKATWPLYFVAQAFVFNRKFGMLYLLGLIVDVIMKVLLKLY
ncbi:MAG: prenyltransferase [Candidatus Firestonebacteria bacterium]